MKSIFTVFEDFLEQNKERIIEEILQVIDQSEPEIYTQLSNQEKLNRARGQLEQLITLMGREGSGESLQTEIHEWAKQSSQEKVNLGMTLYQSIQQFNMIRKAVWRTFDDLVNENPEINVRQSLELGTFINQFIDQIILTFTTYYTSLSNKRLKAQQEVIDELSTPVISIVDGVAALPIIGEIDTHRAKVLMEHTLHETSKQGVECLIIDLSGVFIVDTMVAQELFKIISSLELTGVEVNLTGIRPELAQSVVTLGINFDNVKLFNNLGQALKAYGIVRK